MKIHNFFFTLGHTESETMACLLFQHLEGFDTAWGGLRSIAGVVTQHLKAQTINNQNPCCRGMLEKDPDANFCSQCGSPLLSEPEDNEHASFFDELFFSRNSDVSPELHVFFEDAGWDLWPNDFDTRKAVCVRRADDLILSAATNPTPDDYDLMFLELKHPEMKVS